MGLFGALFAGVSGLDSQSNKIGIISNNISNVNTVGFKQGQAAFNTLVVPSGTTSFSPGGVIGNTQQLVSQQGLIQATSSSTDVAITGNGFFAVNSKSDGSGSLLLTRAGSFTQDSSGNFINANGFFLQGIPVTTPATSVNINNLKTVSVNQNATGTATATSQVTIGANLNSTQAILLGAPVVGTMSSTNGTTSGVNNSVTGSQILVGSDLGGPGVHIARGDTIAITSGSNPPLTFTYGGFGIGRNVLTAINGVSTAGNGDGSKTLDTESILGGAITNLGGGSSTITVAVANIQDYSVNGHISISGSSGIGTITASQINGEHSVATVSGPGPGAGTVTFTVTGGGNSGAAGNSATAASVANRTYPFTGNILNATSATSDFLNNGTNPLQLSSFTSTALKFSIIAGGVGYNFSYSSAPSTSASTFNSLQSLSDAISAQTGLTARVQSGRLYVSSTDATQSVTFANGDANGSGGLAGIDWVQELDLAPINVPPPATTAHMFNSLNGLANQVNTADPTNLLATVSNPTATASITINEANPQQPIVITDGVPGSILTELGVANLQPAGGSSFTTGTLPAVYNPSSATTDMSSGKVTPQFSHDITVFDSQGNSHTIAMNVVKTAINTWAVEFTVIPKSDAISTTGDGQIASGTLTFSGNGILQSDTVPNSVNVVWKNGAAPSTLKFDLGLGGSGNVSQSAAPYNVSLAKQNGSPIGQLTSVTIDANGFVIETFSNGQTQQVFQIPLANVSNPDGLQSVSGDAFQQTLDSGQVNLNVTGTGGTGTIAPSSLEQSNVDLSTQLTSLIVAQQAYGANSKLLTVASQLLQQLDQIIQ